MATPDRTIVTDSVLDAVLAPYVARLAAQEAGPRLYPIATVDTPDPVGYRRGTDYLVVATAPTAPVVLPYRRFYADGLAAGTVLTTAIGGPDDTKFETVVGGPTLRINGAVREWEFTSDTTGREMTWTGLNLTDFSLSMTYRHQVTPASSGVPTVWLTGVGRLTMDTANKLTLFDNTPTYKAISPAALLVDGTRYRLNIFRTGGGNTQIRMYNPDGTSFWSTSQALGAGALTSVRLGRMSGVAFRPFIGDVSLQNNGTERGA